MRRRSWQEWTLFLLALAGLLLSAYGLSLHYSPDGGSFCNISASLDCDKVNKSPWATFLGIPVALFGMLAYLAVALLVLKRKTIQKLTSFTDEDFWRYLFFMVLVMFLFQAYLTFVEIYYIHAYCIICLGSQLAILLMTAITGLLWTRSVTR